MLVFGHVSPDCPLTAFSWPPAVNNSHLPCSYCDGVTRMKLRENPPQAAVARAAAQAGTAAQRFARVLTGVR